MIKSETLFMELFVDFINRFGLCNLVYVDNKRNAIPGYLYCTLQFTDFIRNWLTMLRLLRIFNISLPMLAPQNFPYPKTILELDVSMSSISPPSSFFFLQTLLHQTKKAEVNIEINKSVFYTLRSSEFKNLPNESFLNFNFSNKSSNNFSYKFNQPIFQF